MLCYWLAFYKSTQADLGVKIFLVFNFYKPNRFELYLLNLDAQQSHLSMMLLTFYKPIDYCLKMFCLYCFCVHWLLQLLCSLYKIPPQDRVTFTLLSHYIELICDNRAVFKNLHLNLTAKWPLLTFKLQKDWAKLSTNLFARRMLQNIQELSPVFPVLCSPGPTCVEHEGKSVWSDMMYRTCLHYL